MVASLNQPLFGDFVRFSRLQLESGDIDPAYPVLRALFDDERLSRERRVWRLLLYVAFYDIQSAELAWLKYPDPTTSLDFGNLPTGIERRGFRGVDGNRKAARMLASVVRGAPSGLWSWVQTNSLGSYGWKRTRDAFEFHPGNGSWASYKWADLTKHVLQQSITADDIGIGGGGKNAGPIPGLCRLYPELDWQTAATDAVLHQRLLEKSLHAGVSFGGLDQLETCLCDFNSLCKGHYYVGHDIDVQQWSTRHLKANVQKARAKSFPAAYLGEVGGWEGPRKGLLKIYAEEGKMEWRKNT